MNAPVESRIARCCRHIGIAWVFSIGVFASAGARAASPIVFVIANGIPAVDRPATPVVHVDGERLTVVGMRDDHPLVLEDGEQRAVSEPIALIPGDTFQPGFIKISAQYGTTEFNRTSAIYTDFLADLTADRDLENVFVVATVFEEPTDADAMPRVKAVGSAIGKLKAGKPKSIDVASPPVTSLRSLYWSLLVYGAEGQIRTSMGSFGLQCMFDEIDRRRFDWYTKKRSSGTSSAMNFRQFPLRFSDVLNRRYAGRTLKATIGFGSDGVPSLERTDAAEDPELNEALDSQLSTWLLFPRVEKGRTLESHVVIPIRFGNETKPEDSIQVGHESP